MRDRNKAVELFREAAEMENPDGLYNLGRCYYFGEGVEQNYYRAASLFLPAARKGHREAQHWLAVCYYEGEGVKEDRETAKYWFDSADKSDARLLAELEDIDEDL